MFTTTESGTLLRDAGGGPLAPIVRALGFREPLPVQPRLARELGLADAGVEIAEGVGALRALIIEWAGGGALDANAAVCRALAEGSPTQLWLVVARDRARQVLIIAAPPIAGRGSIQAMQVDLRRVLDSDAETLAAMSAVSVDTEGLLHARWREILGRDGLTRRFYRDFERAVTALAETAEGSASGADRRTVAVLHGSRLLFLAFLEAKGLLDRDRAFLRRAFERRCGGRGAHRRFLEPLFFGTLNTPPERRASAARAFGAVPFLNGGLFTRTPVEKRTRALRFTDDALAALIGDLLGGYRITAHESSGDWSEAAVDPEMLGRAFESLMATDARRSGGVFYTPQPLIARLTSQAIDRAIEGSPDGSQALDALDRIRVLDPACGSGAFLVFALENLADRRAAAGDPRPLSVVRRELLTRSIFGVDRDPTAVWLCQLRLWLSVIVEDDACEGKRLEPLPNLDRNIREGDALSGEGFDAIDPHVRPVTAGKPPRSIESLRVRYTRSTGARKRSLAAVLEHEERQLAVRAAESRLVRLRAERLDLLASVRSRDLFQERPPPDRAVSARLSTLRAAVRAAHAAARRLRDGGALPFAFATHFPSLAAEGGLGIVLGNPPWVRLHRIPQSERDALRARFECYRDAAWLAGASAASAGRGFASQVDLSALFVERAVKLTRPGGVVALLVPAKLWSALAGGGLRHFLAREAPAERIETWSESNGGFDAAVYPSALVARRISAERAGAGVSTLAAVSAVACVRHDVRGSAAWRIPRSRLAFDCSPGAPWLLLSRAARRAFDRLILSGVPLAESTLGRPILGVKTGCNAAFVVRRTDGDGADTEIDTDAEDAGAGVGVGVGAGDETLARVESGACSGFVSRSSLRPVLRGEALRAFGARCDGPRDWIVWTHDANSTPRTDLSAADRRWLMRWRRELESRSDGRHARWWSLFRTEAARHDLPRVVWGDIGRRTRASVLALGDPAVPLNSCYVVRVPELEDAYAFAALLNSPVADGWLRALAEPARGGYRRYLGWTCALLPIPREWARARALLAPIGRMAACGSVPDDATLTAASCEAYGLGPTDIAPLLEWDAQ